MIDPHYHINDFIFYVRQRSSDIPIIKEVISQNCYNADLIKPHDIVIDIGGHIGSFTVFASSKGCNVFTYEAVQRNFDLLEKNVEINGFPAKIHKNAVAGKNEMRTIYVRAFNYGGSNLYTPNADPEWQEPVQCITLNNIFSDNGLDKCDFLKMDCEGAELEILEAFHDLRKIKHMVMEYHGGGRGEELEKLLSKTHNVHVQFQTVNQLGMVTADVK